MATDPLEPIAPRNVDEWLRVAHALRWGSHVDADSVYIVMSTVPPLYQIQGIRASLQDARALLDQSIADEMNWSTAERDARQIFGPVEVPELSFENSFALVGKPWYTGSYFIDDIGIGTGSPPGLPKPNEITGCRLTIDWTHGGEPYSRYWNLSPDTMAIFLTRGAAEMFLYPHDQAFFGHEHEQELRARNGHDEPHSQD
jgi:hypothetical protein